MKYPAPISISLTEKRYRLRARLRFSADCQECFEGQTLESIILDELALQFSHQNPYLTNMIGNDYDFPEFKDKRIKVASHFSVVTTPPYIHFHFMDVPGICSVPLFIFWRHQRNKHIFLFRSDIRTKKEFSALNIGKIAAHEFGHALGINDLYAGWAPYALKYRPAAAITVEMPAHDIMRTHFIDKDFFTPNDLEMAWLAQNENAPQTHVPIGFYKGLRHQSRAIRLNAL